MPPKKMPVSEKFRCDQVQGEKFHTHADESFRYNWWEVFCFPYILCSRFWDCFITMCSGSNQCMIYWMLIQWIVCKITQMTTPGAVVFPYYFYIFCQVAGLTLAFGLICRFFGKTIIIPFFVSFYNAIMDDGKLPPKKKNTTKISFRKYCFKKGEILDNGTFEKNSSYYLEPVMQNIFLSVVHYVLTKYFNTEFDVNI